MLTKSCFHGRIIKVKKIFGAHAPTFKEEIMQFKKYLGILLVAVMLISCMLLAVACNGDENPTEQPTTAPTDAPTNAPTEEPTEEPTEAPTVEIPTTPTEAPTADPDEGKVEYEVVVKDGEGNPVEGVRVVVCKDETCFNPVLTDENGVAVFKLEEYNGYKGKVSKAEGYEFSEEYTYFENGAKRITITVKAICDHVEETVAGTPATCVDAGLTDGVICSVCGEILTAQKEIPATGVHTEVVVKEGTEVSCKYDGLTDEIGCSVCGATLSEQVTIPATGHTPGAEPTCTEAQKCVDCNETLAPKLGHSYESIYATVCSVCNDEREVPTHVGTIFGNFTIGSTEVSFSSTESYEFRGATLESFDKTTGAVVISKLYAGVKLSIQGSAGFSSIASKFGYYIDDDSNNVIESAAGRLDAADRPTVGNKGKSFDITVDTYGLTAGEHKITFVAIFGSGICVDVAEWTVNVVDRTVDSDKPTANVIIISGQSNAYGASPFNDGIRAEYGNKDYSNVYIHYNNINVVVDGSADGGTWKTLFSNNSFEQYKLGVGGQGDLWFGPELGIVDYLTANGYADDAPLYIIKFTAAGTFLNGQWFPGAYDVYGLVDDMGAHLYDQMRDYIDESLAMIPDEYNIQIQSFFWVQGESDAGDPNVAAQYGDYEQMLLNSIRSDFIEYAAADGISFVNYAIAETPEGNINWVYSQTVNQCKKDNCGYWYDPKELTETGGELITNETPAIKNSYLVLADILRSKATAGDYEVGSPSTDYAHMCGDDMVLLGKWMATGMLYLENLNNAE